MQEPKPQENLREVLRRGFEALGELDPVSVAAHSGGRAAPSGHSRRPDRAAGDVIVIGLLGRELAVDIAAREVRDPEGAPVGDHIAAVVVRHLLLAGRLPGDPGPDVSFADDPDARGYLGPFRGRVLGPLLGKFGRDPDGFARAAVELGGERVEDMEGAGALAFRIRVFPRVSLVFILHPGDDEFPPDGQVLFPREVLRAFDVEDAVVTAELAGRALRGRL